MSETASHIAFVSVGSNLGDRLENCRRGIEAVRKSDGIEGVKHSPFYQTEPVDFKDQGWFINCAIMLRTGLEPSTLLSRLRWIEKELGRTEGGLRFGPRIIDLDILLFSDRVIRTVELTVPHPRMHKRRFVLKPICDIDPYVVHPVLKCTVMELLARLDVKDQRIIPYPCDS
ncbi:MAG: 2-amino-4-hydroxy-6-hydroxymethyldihydropteridine diphosphokinase [Desulfobacteraceae bacterium]|nr:MAG: 2-amino-4-hydroxy-6-hydroxymethyldihydropteridine diphosphokinase [Desulfobacteraceae bacterium]